MRYNRKTIEVLEKPALSPVTLSELKSFLKIDDSNEDDVLSTIILGCVDQAQVYCRSYFLNHSLRFTLDFPPNARHDYDLKLGDGAHEGYRGFFQGENSIDLPFAPIVSITSVKTYSVANVESTFSSANYRLDGFGARLYLNQGIVWPSGLRDYAAFVVQYVAGYGAAPQSVPAGLKLALLAYCSHAYECRGDCSMTDEMAGRFYQYKKHEGLALLS